MSYDNRVTIERATNGYTVTMRDPKIVAANRKRDFSDTGAPYRDPEKIYIFTTMDALTKFLTANLDKALPADDFGSTFDTLSDDEDDD